MGNFQAGVAEEVRRHLKDSRFQSAQAQNFGVTGGRVFFVLKAAATNYTQFVEDHPDYKSGDGVVTAAAVYNTVDEAINACTANQGDVIYVMPGHTETITSGSIALDVAGTSVICLGRGKNQAVFTYSATTSKITVGAASCTFKGGFHVPAAGIAVVTAFLVGAATDFLLEGAIFEDASSTGAFTSIVTTGSTTLAANGLSIVGNYHLGLATSPAATISILGNTDRLYVADNFVDSAATNDIGHFITAAALVLRGARIVRNTLNVVSATNAAVGIFMTSSASTDTGIIAYNLVSSLDSTAALLITDSTGLRAFENYLTTDANASGALWPVVGNPA